MPSARFVHTVATPAPPEAAFLSLQAAATWESIGAVREVRDARHDPDGWLLGYLFTVEVGGRRYPGEASVTGAEPHSLMTVDLLTSEMVGAIDVVLEPEDGRTLVTVGLTVRSKGLVSAMAFPVISSAIGSGLPANVEAFAGRLG